MPAQLTEEERAAVEAAVAAGKVRRLPPGTTGQTRYVWSEQDKKLVVREGSAPGGLRADHARKRARNAAHIVAPEVAQRRMAVRDRTQAGQSVGQIAEALGVTINTVYRDLQALGMKPAVARRIPSIPPELQAQRDRLRALVAAQELTGAEIAAELGRSRYWVYKTVQKLGLRLQAPSGGGAAPAEAPEETPDEAPDELAEEPAPEPELPPPPDAVSEPQRGGGIGPEVQAWLLTLDPLRLYALRGEVLGELDRRGVEV